MTDLSTSSVTTTLQPMQTRPIVALLVFFSLFKTHRLGPSPMGTKSKS